MYDRSCTLLLSLELFTRDDLIMCFLFSFSAEIDLSKIIEYPGFTVELDESMIDVCIQKIYKYLGSV